MRTTNHLNPVPDAVRCWQRRSTSPHAGGRLTERRSSFNRQPRLTNSRSLIDDGSHITPRLLFMRSWNRDFRETLHPRAHSWLFVTGISVRPSNAGVPIVSITSRLRPSVRSPQGWPQPRRRSSAPRPRASRLIPSFYNRTDDTNMQWCKRRCA